MLFEAQDFLNLLKQRRIQLCGGLNNPGALLELLDRGSKFRPWVEASIQQVQEVFGGSLFNSLFEGLEKDLEELLLSIFLTVKLI